jgi:hypothetical protein
MKDNELNALLAKLNDELEKTDQVDATTLALLQELEDDLHRLGASGAAAQDYESVINQAQALETRFAADHPRAERFIREIMDMLAKVGI